MRRRPVKVSGKAPSDTLDFHEMPAIVWPQRQPFDPNAFEVGRNLALNIVQHPEGRPKLAAIRNNVLTSVAASELRYFTDTRGGSSGAPVMDDGWRVVGLHRGSRNVMGVSFQGRSTAWVNIGTPITAILAALSDDAPALLDEIAAA